MNESNINIFGQYRTLNIIMLWLFTLTLLLLLLPFADFAPALAERISSSRTYLVIALIAAASNFIAQFIVACCSRISQSTAKKRAAARLQQAVTALDFAERALLREFVLQRKSVLTLPLAEPTVRSLVDSGILKVLNLPSDEAGRSQLAIAKAARPLITYRAIGLSRGKMTEEAISQIMAARPEYAREKKPMPRAYRGARAA